MTWVAIDAVGGIPPHVRLEEVAISEIMRLGPNGDSVLGMWEPAKQRIVIRRDQLGSPQAYFGTLLHETAHATSGETDGSLAFDDALTAVIGMLGQQLLTPAPQGGHTPASTRPD